MTNHFKSSLLIIFLSFSYLTVFSQENKESDINIINQLVKQFTHDIPFSNYNETNFFFQKNKYCCTGQHDLKVVNSNDPDEISDLKFRYKHFVVFEIYQITFDSDKTRIEYDALFFRASTENTSLPAGIEYIYDKKSNAYVINKYN